jgi:hypothetical protein
MDNWEALSRDIADDERLARAVFYPHHIAKSGKIKKEAFKAPTGRRDVSVNRLRAIGADECKMRAKSIRNPGEFKGFAVVSAADVRQSGSDVVDSREFYFGHADIMHDVVLESGVPAPPEFNQRLKQLAKRAAFFVDPSPDSDAWSGEDLVSNG